MNLTTYITCYTLPPTSGSPNPLAISSINNTAQINHSELCTVTYNSNNSIPSSSHDKNKLWIYNNQSSTVHGLMWSEKTGLVKNLEKTEITHRNETRTQKIHERL